MHFFNHKSTGSKVVRARLLNQKVTCLRQQFRITYHHTHAEADLIILLLTYQHATLASTLSALLPSSAYRYAPFVHTATIALQKTVDPLGSKFDRRCNAQNTLPLDVHTAFCYV